MKSLGAMILQLEGLLGTPDISQWEGEFIASVIRRTAKGTYTSELSEKQIDVVETMWQKHFAG